MVNSCVGQWLSYPCPGLAQGLPRTGEESNLAICQKSILRSTYNKAILRESTQIRLPTKARTLEHSLYRMPRIQETVSVNFSPRDSTQGFGACRACHFWSGCNTHPSPHYPAAVLQTTWTVKSQGFSCPHLPSSNWSTEMTGGKYVIWICVDSGDLNAGRSSVVPDKGSTH